MVKSKTSTVKTRNIQDKVWSRKGNSQRKNQGEDGHSVNTPWIIQRIVIQRSKRVSFQQPFRFIWPLTFVPQRAWWIHWSHDLRKRYQKISKISISYITRTSSCLFMRPSFRRNWKRIRIYLPPRRKPKIILHVQTMARTGNKPRTRRWAHRMSPPHEG